MHIHISTPLSLNCFPALIFFFFLNPFDWFWKLQSNSKSLTIKTKVPKNSAMHSRTRGHLTLIARSFNIAGVKWKASTYLTPLSTVATECFCHCIPPPPYPLLSIHSWTNTTRLLGRLTSRLASAVSVIGPAKDWYINRHHKAKRYYLIQIPVDYSEEAAEIVLWQSVCVRIVFYAFP